MTKTNRDLSLIIHHVVINVRIIIIFAREKNHGLISHFNCIRHLEHMHSFRVRFHYLGIHEKHHG